MNNHRSSHDIITGSLDMKRIRLATEQMVARHSFDRRDLEFMQSGQLQSFYDQAAQRMIHEFAARVASKKYDVKTVRFPADWWQGCKRRFLNPAWRFSRWALNRWPVKYTEVTLEATAYYPGIAIPDQRAYVEIRAAARNIATMRGDDDF